ncbi:MAG: iron permease [Gammaproteobacteria bacterium]|nr:MAG: iron permease [Gammaproteobacteria bacterium]
MNRIYSVFILFIFFGMFVTSSYAQNAPQEQVTQLRQLSQLAEYVGVDYAAAIEKGEISNANEYQEMLEFSALIVNKTQTITSKNSQALVKQAQVLQQSVIQKSPLAQVREHSAKLRGSLLAMMPAMMLPNRLLSLENTQSLFQESCASCHGVLGQGNGILAKQLSPEPTDFTDKERASNRSLIGLFDAISNGLDDTSMPAFTQLKEQQRWSLAFYVGSLAFQSQRGISTDQTQLTLPTLENWLNYSPNQVAASVNNLTHAQAGQLRADPSVFFSQTQTPISITKSQLTLALAAHAKQKYQQASTLAVSAYLDGFELVENSLDARDSKLRKAIEVNLIALRQLISSDKQAAELSRLSTQVFQQLTQAEQLLTGEALSNTALFSASLVILLREGLEALLVVIALITVLVRTNRRDALKFVHIGWFTALIAGVGTWAAAQTLISISGASREVMEGVASLLAAIMLLYVGIWMHSKTNAAQWQAYIQKHIDSQLKAGTLWGLAALSFIAVYREVFETVLFYQSLLTQALPEQYSVAISGFVVGLVILAIVAWLMLKYSVKLPIAKFFASTTYLLLALSFILMGKAVSALQEAAKVGISALPVNIELSWLGIGSTWQGILSQLAVLVFFLVYRFISKDKQLALA